MHHKRKKVKSIWQNFILFIIWLLTMIAFMVVSWRCMNVYLISNTTPYALSKIGFILLILFYFAIYFQVIIHETGHLIFGLLTGYKFNSFRIMNFMLIKENGKIRLKRFSLAGTSGQCLLNPPDFENGALPYVLYNFGGVILNLISVVIFLGVAFVFIEYPILSSAMLCIAIVGLFYAALNGIPLQMGINNDGYNAVSIRKNPEALRAFYLQMKVVEAQSKGVRIKDMPKEWFCVPSDDSMKNSMVAVIGAFACNYLMDNHEFQNAEHLMNHILEMDSGPTELHYNALLCDRLYIELITENREKMLQNLYTDSLKSFMKKMRTNLSVIRTQYAYAVLYERDMKKAKKLQAKFEKISKSYPYLSEVQAEREFMDIVDKKIVTGDF